MGNVFVEDTAHPEQLDRTAGANVSDLSHRFPTATYLTAHSDIVAHLVLAHQTQMHNLITVANYKTRLALHAARALRGLSRVHAMCPARQRASSQLGS